MPRAERGAILGIFTEPGMWSARPTACALDLDPNGDSGAPRLFEAFEANRGLSPISADHFIGVELGSWRDDPQ